MRTLPYKIFLSATLLLGACTYEVQEPERCVGDHLDRALSYGLDVAPIIRSSCTLPSCHVSGFEEGDFTNFSDLKDKAEHGLLESVIKTNQMPHTNTYGPKVLTDCEKKVILQWIRRGSINN